MARAVWTGTISFGLVNVPVKSYTAVRDHEVHFHQLDKQTGARVRYEKVSEKTHEELDADDIEMGYEVTKGKYVTFEKGELEKLQPASTRMLEVTDFVDLSEIDPIYYDRTYWLGPDGDAAARAYRLLQSVMEAEERVGIGTVVMRNKQYLAAVRPLDGVLAMSTLRFADEIVSRADLDLPAKGTKPSTKELGLAKKILDALAGEWKPEQYHDTYTEQLREIIDRKAEGKTVEPEEPVEADAKVLDLMAALQQSVDDARKRRGTKATSGAKTAKATGAAGATAKKKSAVRPAKGAAKASGSKASGSKASGSKSSGSKASGAKRPARKSA